MQEVISTKKITNNRYVKSIRNQSTLIDLTYQFTSLNRPSSKDITLFREQFYTLVLNTNSTERKQIAKELARSEYAPKAIIIFFAMEEIAIANLPLLYSPVLQSSDINLILAKCSFEHAKVIARRNNLDASNIKTLMKLDNESKQINGILKANTSLTENMDTPKTSDAWIAQPAQVITDQSVEITKPIISDHSKDLSASLLKLANKSGKLARKPIGKPAKSAFKTITLKQIEKQLLATARYNDFEAFATSVQHFCGLNYQTTFNFIKKQDAGMLATLLCALEVSDVTAARILLMMNRDIGRNAQIFKVIMKKYRNLNHKECVLYFKKIGADFTQTHINEGNNEPTTRYALSLAARDRRASLLEQDQLGETNYYGNKLTA